MNISLDHSELDEVAVDLAKAPGRIARTAPKVLKTGAFKAKQNLQRDADGHRHLDSFAHHVAFEQLDGLGLDYEIGFNKSGQGKLAPIMVFGSVNNAPIMGTPADALRKEMPAILIHLADAGADAVFGGRR